MGFNVGRLELPWALIARSKTCLVNAVAQWFDYVDGKRTEKQKGYLYSCVLPSNGYQTIVVKVEESAPSITVEQIEAAGGAVEVEPVNFVGKIYVPQGGRAGEVSCKASAVTPVAKKV
jgi:hypothetical protein